jgi:hypothetical protein
MPAIKLTYFDLRARAEVARLILAQVLILSLQYLGRGVLHLYLRLRKSSRGSGGGSWESGFHYYT